MSTKSLNRSVHEVGHGRSYNKDRKFENKALRARERAYISDLKKNPDACDEIADPEIGDLWTWHNSTLTPVFRWLRAQDGRQWNEVYSELCQKVSIEDKAFKWLEYRIHKFGTPNYSEDQSIFYHKNTFYIDENGTFHKAKKIAKPKRQPSKYTKAQIAEWLNGRIVGKVGAKIYWFHIVSDSAWADDWKCAWNSNWYPTKSRQYSYDHYYSNNYNNLIYVKKTYNDIYKDGLIVRREEDWRPAFGKPGARQYKELSDADLEFWNDIPDYYQEKILEWSPTSDANPLKSKYNWW